MLVDNIIGESLWETFSSLQINMKERALNHQESLAKVCAVCTNLRGDKAGRRVKEVEVELIRLHVHSGYLLNSNYYPQVKVQVQVWV